MRTLLLRTLTVITLATACAGPRTAAPGAPSKTEVMVVGFAHLNQLYREGVPESDVLSARRQEELAQLVTQLERFQPDLILVEVEPSEQATLDAAYAPFLHGQVAQSRLARSETYQVAFALAKRRGLPGVYGVDGVMMLKAARPHMAARGGGAVVNFSSGSAEVAQAGRWLYPASKAAIVQLTRSEAMDLAPDRAGGNDGEGWISRSPLC